MDNSSQVYYTQSSQSSQSNNVNLKNGFIKGLYNFLNFQLGTILAMAIGICLGGAFKDLIQNLVTNIMQPLIVKLLIITKIYNISLISAGINEEHTIVNLASAFSAIITFIITVITVFFIFMLLSSTNL
jgi:large-conductance mechanosensitive channel